jgi:hypothetical protein
VVAEGDHICAGAQEPVRELRRDPRAVRHVLAVHDADVGSELVAQLRQPSLDRVAAGDAEDVGEEENSQLSTSDAAGRSVTDTWLPESFV